MTPRATVRLQFDRGFTLDDAAATVPYYAALGISHFYASPVFAARPGSSHGYDVIDYQRINPELGGPEALWRLVDRLRAHGMGLVLDIVPNHMAASTDNLWWLDVLEWGRDSPYADWFDIDWDDPDPSLRNRVLLPLLGDDAGKLVERGELRLVFDPGDGRLWLEVPGHRLPLAAVTYPEVLGRDGVASALAVGFDHHRDHGALRDVLGRLRDELRGKAGSSDAAAGLASALQRFDTGTPEGRARLRALVERQAYQLAPWSQAWARINWRRFFDINELVSLRAERDDVFEASHSMVLDLYARGAVDGLRIDHVDGLSDPGGYCRRLRERMAALEPGRPAWAPRGRAWLLVEKILAAGEQPRMDWDVDGTTGYEFMDEVGALLHSPAGGPALDVLWQELADAAGEVAGYGRVARSARRQMLDDNFAADVERALRALQILAAEDTDPPPSAELRDALVELLVEFPRYRTYVGVGSGNPEDSEVLSGSAARAHRTGRSPDRATMQRLLHWLGGEPPSDAAPEAADAIERVQQLTPPLAAKALEDTAFYRYGRLISRNEVGADPGQLALDVDAFHAACVERARSRPHGMLSTATHDHKRGEDVRARLAVLSEAADAWCMELREWRALNAPLRSTVDARDAPDAIDESMLYQTLLGALPPAHPEDGRPLPQDFLDRMVRWQRKSLREAKRRSSWIDPDEAYEAGCEAFVGQLGRSDAAQVFRRRLASFGQRIAAAGAINGLVQMVLRTTTPGVPDLYRGCEFWDLSLVDPDNRGPVDHAARAEALRSGDSLDTLLAAWPDGRIKQHVLHRLLRFRAAQPSLFAHGGYTPLELVGARAQHAVAFARSDGRDACVVVVARHPWTLADGASPRIAPRHWQQTVVRMPGAGGRAWRDVISGAVHRTDAAQLDVAAVLTALPVSLLHATDGATVV